MNKRHWDSISQDMPGPKHSVLPKGTQNSTDAVLDLWISRIGHRTSQQDTNQQETTIAHAPFNFAKIRWHVTHIYELLRVQFGHFVTIELTRVCR